MDRVQIVCEFATIETNKCESTPRKVIRTKLYCNQKEDQRAKARLVSLYSFRFISRMIVRITRRPYTFTLAMVKSTAGMLIVLVALRKAGSILVIYLLAVASLFEPFLVCPGEPGTTSVAQGLAAAPYA